MESKNKDDTVSSKKDTYKKLLDKLECPFTWNMDDVVKSTNTEYNPHDEEESLPLLKLLRTIMTVYVDVKNNAENDPNAILKNLDKCDDDFAYLVESAHPEISTKVVSFVLQSTKCFVYFELDMQEKLEFALKKIENLDDMSNKEKSTLLACNSICWSKYHVIGSRQAEKLIREAIKLNGNCDLWHFILGKNIRRQRRDLSIIGKPDDEESSSFLKAYEISKNPIYGIFVAQMYREMKHLDKALNMYEAMFNSSDSLSNTVLLRLALGFINLQQLDKAKICLDDAEKSCATHSMYLHYRGIYYMKRKQFSKASHFFKEAIKDNNLPAEKQYLECMLKINKSFDVTGYLVYMLNKYGTYPQHRLQSLILDVAFSFWKRERDMEKALAYFLQAIEIDPQARCLMNFYNKDIYPIRERNVYVFLEKCILPVVNQQRHQFDKITLQKADAIKEFCNVNKETQISNIESAFTRINIKK